MRRKKKKNKKTVLVIGIVFIIVGVCILFSKKLTQNINKKSEEKKIETFLSVENNDTSNEEKEDNKTKTEYEDVEFVLEISKIDLK